MCPIESFDKLSMLGKSEISCSYDFLIKLLILLKLSETNCSSDEAVNLSNRETDGKVIVSSQILRGMRERGEHLMLSSKAY